MRRGRQWRWRAGATVGTAIALFLVPAYAKDGPSGDVEELRKTVQTLEERIRRLEADHVSEDIQQEHEELRPRFGLDLGIFADVDFSSTP